MSDYLVKRLKDGCVSLPNPPAAGMTHDIDEGSIDTLMEEAADRIEALEAELATARHDALEEAAAVSEKRSRALRQASQQAIAAMLCALPDAIRALKGGDASTPEVTVGPGKLERIVWSAMSWARDNPGPPDVTPEYTDHGNSFAEDECRATVRRILAALET